MPIGMLGIIIALLFYLYNIQSIKLLKLIGIDSAIVGYCTDIIQWHCLMHRNFNLSFKKLLCNKLCEKKAHEKIINL